MYAIPREQSPAVYHRRIGDVVVTCVSDGYLDAGLAALQGINLDEAESIFKSRLRPARRASVNCFLIHAADYLALIDTGCGTYLKSTAGKLQQSLAAAGVHPADIDAVLLTHIHPDHSSGLTDQKTGKRIFENAELIVHEHELKHWFNDELMSAASEGERLYFFQYAREQISPYLNVVRTFNENTEICPGVTSFPLPGHTPGHSGYLVESGSESLLIWGDLIHVPEVQIERPEVTMSFDVDPAQAERTRRNVLAEMALGKRLVAGMHIDFPGFAHVVREGRKFTLLPEPWLFSIEKK